MATSLSLSPAPCSSARRLTAATIGRRSECQGSRITLWYQCGDARASRASALARHSARLCARLEARALDSPVPCTLSNAGFDGGRPGPGASKTPPRLRRRVHRRAGSTVRAASIAPRRPSAGAWLFQSGTRAASSGSSIDPLHSTQWIAGGGGLLVACSLLPGGGRHSGSPFDARPVQPMLLSPAAHRATSDVGVDCAWLAACFSSRDSSAICLRRPSAKAGCAASRAAVKP
jgi:hypothetical protein